MFRGTGVVDPSVTRISGRDVQVALSNPSYQAHGCAIDRSARRGRNELSILDGRGRLIRKLSAFSDETRIVWDGRGGNGTTLRRGIIS